MICRGKRAMGKRPKIDCRMLATWRIGTARVPYCDECAARFPIRIGKLVIHRERLEQPLPQGDADK